MALMEVIKYGDPILRRKCQKVKDFKELQVLIDDMFDTMYEESGIGLAANQVGVDLNLFIIDISDFKKSQLKNIISFAKKIKTNPIKNILICRSCDNGRDFIMPNCNSIFSITIIPNPIQTYIITSMGIP